MAYSEIVERNELIRRGDLLQTLRNEKIPVDADVNYFICNAKPVDAIPLEWVSVNDRLPEPYFPIWAACKAEGRENWVIETIYIPNPQSKSQWGPVPILETGRATVYAWAERHSPEAPKEETYG